MKNKKTKFILLMLSILLLTGCTKNLKDSENKIVTNEKNRSISNRKYYM